MSIRDLAKTWLSENHPGEVSNDMRASKYYPSKDIWFFTFPSTYFEAARSGHLNILLQHESDFRQFHYLKVPFSFFRENRQKFDIRASGNKFDLHISAKKRDWLVCERSNGVSFREHEK